MKPFKTLFTILITPQKGWGNVASQKSNPDELATQMLYPILGIIAIAVFLLEINFTQNRADSGIEQAIQYAAIAFVQFFATYYALSALIEKLIKTAEIKSRSKIYSAYTLSATTIFYLLALALPRYTQYIAPLSLYIAYIAWSGYRYLNYEDDKTNITFVAIISATLLLLPAIISVALKALLQLIQ